MGCCDVLGPVPSITLDWFLPYFAGMAILIGHGYAKHSQEAMHNMQDISSFVKSFC